MTTRILAMFAPQRHGQHDPGTLTGGGFDPCAAAQQFDPLFDSGKPKSSAVASGAGKASRIESPTVILNFYCNRFRFEWALDQQGLGLGVLNDVVDRLLGGPEQGGVDLRGQAGLGRLIVFAANGDS